MPARSDRIIHQQAQGSLFKTTYSNITLRAKGLCRCQNILNNNIVFTKLLLENAL